MYLLSSGGVPMGLTSGPASNASGELRPLLNGGDKPWKNGGLYPKEKKIVKQTLKGRIYNFLERPTGWKCFLYHFSV